jgi:putative transposase
MWLFINRMCRRKEAHRSRYNNFMTEYRRYYIPNATWFFTVNLAERKNNRLLVEHIDLLRDCFRYVKQQKSFHVDAIVIMPDHLHCIWTLPADDSNYSIRWNMLKGRFSRAIDKGEKISASRLNRRERGIWQRRFWAHLITSQEDYNHHVDYIHWNPVKHGHVKQVIDWPHSSFHQFVERGIYPATWGHSG